MSARIERRGRTLGVMVGSALLVGAAACGPDELRVNVPAEPVETINVPPDPRPVEEEAPAPNEDERPPRVNPGPTDDE